MRETVYWCPTCGFFHELPTHTERNGHVARAPAPSTASKVKGWLLARWLQRRL
jgi:hypothetical protein